MGSVRLVTGSTLIISEVQPKIWTSIYLNYPIKMVFTL